MESLSEFKKNLKENLLELHWQKWHALGVLTHIDETKSIIDLEALILSTLAIGNYDKRLLSSCLEWIQKNKEWIGTSRIKQIAKHFSRIDKKIKKGLISKSVTDYILVLLKDGDLTESLKKISDENIAGDYRDVLSKLEGRNVTVAPVIQKYPLMQLYFRGIFGVNAKAELYLYLLMEGKGNSNRIAREIYYDQKIVYRILKKWAMAGFIREETAKKETLYYLQNERVLPAGIKPRGNWRIF